MKLNMRNEYYFSEFVTVDFVSGWLMHGKNKKKKIVANLN
jgi:hypothetical protein